MGREPGQNLVAGRGALATSFGVALWLAASAAAGVALFIAVLGVLYWGDDCGVGARCGPRGTADFIGLLCVVALAGELIAGVLLRVFKRDRPELGTRLMVYGLAVVVALLLLAIILN